MFPNGAHSKDRGGAPGRELADPAPIGSQRALAMLRRAVDRAGAERRRYIRLSTVVPALGAPEGAVVAAFERIDLIVADLMEEIVADGVEPDRALADHAFAHRLARRAGTVIVVGPGPLVVAPDLASGVPSDPATRAGRALALQLIGEILARNNGVPADQIALGALPPWVAGEPAPGARAIAEVSVRRALFPGHPFTFTEPPLQGAAEVAAAAPPGPLAGLALAHARAMIAAAITTIEELADRGWRTVAGDMHGGGALGGRDAVAERTEAFDALDSVLGARG